MMSKYVLQMGLLRLYMDTFGYNWKGKRVLGWGTYMVFKENVDCLYTKGFAPPFANYIIIPSFYATKKFSRFVIVLCSFHMHLALL
jgi:hypothetical protein